jgi:hypothetical protein
LAPIHERPAPTHQASGPESCTRLAQAKFARTCKKFKGAKMIATTFKKYYQRRSVATVTFSFVLSALLPLWLLAPAAAQEVPGGCGALTMQGRFGPYDYRAGRYIPESTYRSHQALLSTVENAHFTPEVESLRRGKTGALPGGDITYTLHAFPNHHRALIAVAALSEKEKTDKPSGTAYPVECWFQRAITWRPDDNIVRLIYASFLAKKSRQNDAEQQLIYVASQAGDNAFTYHNIGLVYFDMKDYGKALFHAHKAYELGLGVPTLRDLLKNAGKWVEPASAVPVEPTKTTQ